MSSRPKPEKKEEILQMVEEIEKRLGKKKIQNLVLKKILAEVDPNEKALPGKPDTKDH